MSSTIIDDKKTILSTLLKASTDNMADIARKLNGIIRSKDLKPADNDPITIVTPRMVRDWRDKNAIPSTLMFREACRIYFNKSNFDELIFSKEQLISLLSTVIYENFIRISKNVDLLTVAESPRILSKSTNIKTSNLTLLQCMYYWSEFKYSGNKDLLDIHNLNIDVNTLIKLVVNQLSTNDASQYLFETFHKIINQVNSDGLPVQVRFNKCVKPLLHSVLAILWRNSDFEIV